MTYVDGLWLLLLIPVAFLQNMVFTAVSRSRNSGDPQYHRWWAYASNGIWLICQFFIWKHFWAAFQGSEWVAMGIMAVIYTLSTAEGSVYMMKKMLAKEEGKRKVGANDKLDAKLAYYEEEISRNREEISILKAMYARLKAALDNAAPPRSGNPTKH